MGAALRAERRGQPSNLLTFWARLLTDRARGRFGVDLRERFLHPAVAHLLS
jgi:hypothetical protein